jgi:DNA-binding NarL/FixJ family response regulator
VAAEGDALLDPLITRTVVAAFTGGDAARPPDGVDQLTAREIEVLMARGGSNAQIAADLTVSDAHREDPRRPHPDETRPA